MRKKIASASRHLVRLELETNSAQRNCRCARNWRLSRVGIIQGVLLHERLQVDHGESAVFGIVAQFFGDLPAHKRCSIIDSSPVPWGFMLNQSSSRER